MDRSLLGILIVLVASTIAGAQSPCKTTWSEAIKAQGGMDALLNVKNEVIVAHPTGGRSGRVETVYDFPNRWWMRDDARPSVLGVTVRMEDFAKKVTYVSHNDTSDSPLSPMDRARLDQTVDASGTAVWLPTATYLLLTKWAQPTIVGCRRAKYEGKSVDVVAATSGGTLLDFYFDTKTHINVRIASKSADGTLRDAVDLRGHKIVGGITVPTKVKYSDGSQETLSFHFNVRINQVAFEKTVLLGADVWTDAP